MKTFKDHIMEMSDNQAGRVAVRAWTDQADEKSAPLKMPKPDNTHNEKMFSFHAKMAAAAKAKGDTKGHEYHSTKIKQYS